MFLLSKLFFGFCLFVFLVFLFLYVCFGYFWGRWVGLVLFSFSCWFGGTECLINGCLKFSPNLHNKNPTTSPIFEEVIIAACYFEYVQMWNWLILEITNTWLNVEWAKIRVSVQPKKPSVLSFPTKWAFPWVWRNQQLCLYRRKVFSFFIASLQLQSVIQGRKKDSNESAGLVQQTLMHVTILGITN